MEMSSIHILHENTHCRYIPVGHAGYILQQIIHIDHFQYMRNQFKLFVLRGER